VVRLVTGGEEGAVSVVTAPRDTDPRPLVQPVVEAMETAGARVARTRGDRVPAQLAVLAEADLVVVGRADLLDLEVAVQLAEALRDGSRLMLVGDPQLPPAAGPGRVLATLSSLRRCRCSRRRSCRATSAPWRISCVACAAGDCRSWTPRSARWS
jgi:hypothetical protein